MIRKIVFALVIALSGVIAVLWLRHPPRSSAGATDAPEAEGPQLHRIADGRRPAVAKPRVTAKRADRPKPVPSRADDDDDEESRRTPEERKLAEDIEKALDEEDFELAKACAPLAVKCKDAEIRQSMVDTLAWFGEKAIPELTPFIADPDEDVAENAMSEWDSAVSSIDDDNEKITLVELAMAVVSDEDALESIAGEYIGVDERLAVESILRVIEHGGSKAGIAKAKETYEFVTGDEFTDRAAAEKWLAEEYEPPEPSPDDPQ